MKRPMKDFGLLLARSGILVKITDSCSYKIVPMKKINLIVFIYSLIGNIFYSGSARSSRLQMFYFYKKGVLQIFAKLTGKHVSVSYLIELQALGLQL